MINLAATNKVLPKAGLNGFDWTFVQGSTFVLRLNFCAKNPRLRQYPNRRVPFCEHGAGATANSFWLVEAYAIDLCYPNNLRPASMEQLAGKS